MDIEIKDYLTPDEIKEICKDALYQKIREDMRGLNINDIIANISNADVEAMVDAYVGEDDFCKTEIPKKVRNAIESISAFTVFRKADVWERKNSVAYDILEEECRATRPLIKKRVEQIINEYNFPQLECDEIIYTIADVLTDRLLPEKEVSNMGTVNCLRCDFCHKDNGNCTAVGGFCTAVAAAHCPMLREYLDTGLTPELVQETAELAIWVHESGLEKIKEWIKADKEGRIVVLPCKVGDILYKIFKERAKCSAYGECFDEYFCCGCKCECDSIIQYVIRPIQPNTLPSLVQYIGDIGKTVFLTRDDAEKALETMKDG